MEKNKNSLLLAMLGGIVTCFICIGMVFMFTSNSNGTTNFKGNQELPNQQNEVNLGDEAGCNSCMSQCLAANNNDQSYCSGSCSLQCATPTPTPSTTCIQLSSNNRSCSQVTVGGSSCSGNNYSDWASCRSHLSCGSNEYINSTSCQACPSGTHSKSSTCNGLASNCCENNTPTPAPTSTPHINGGTCYNGMSLSKYHYCTVYTGKKCKMSGMGSFQTSGTITCANSSCAIECADVTTTTATPTPTCTYNTQTKCETVEGGTCEKVNGCWRPKRTCVEYGNSGDCRNGGCYWDYSGSGSCINPTPTPAPVSPSPTPRPDTSNYMCCCKSSNTTNCTYRVYCQSDENISTTGCSNTTTVVTPTPAPENVSCWCNPSKTSCSWATGGSSSTPVKVSGIYRKEDCDAMTVRTCCHVDASGNASVGNFASSECVGFPNNVVTDKTTCDKVNKCSLTITNVSGFKHMSYGEREVVKFTISDSVCGDQIVVKTKNFSGAYEAYNGREVGYTPSTSSCVYGTISGCIRGTNICSDTISILLRPTWQHREVKNVKKTTVDSSPKSANQANQQGKDYYYTSCEAAVNGVHPKCTQYYRGCGSVPTGSSPACYKDGSNNYYWTSSPASGWKKVDGISKEADCKGTEEDACYVDTNGQYVWGKYAKTDGYTKIASIKSKSDCKTPTEEYACYKNKFNDYQWAATKPEECVASGSCFVPKTSPTTSSTCTYTTKDACEDVEGYKVVTGVTSAVNCGATENPACYVHGNTYVWGKYASITGYYLIEDITTEASCRLPEGDACYEDKDGKYVWGKYNDNPDYILVPSVTSMSQCNNDVPTPSTGITVSKLVYVFMAMLMACGIGFIYYSTVMKKNDQQQ